MRAATLSILFALAILPAASASAGGLAVASVRNDSDAPVSVTLQGDDGTSVEFADIAPHTTSTPQPLPPLDEVRVVISAGEATAGTVALHGGENNVIAVSASAPPRVDAPKRKKAERPSGSFW